MKKLKNHEIEDLKDECKQYGCSESVSELHRLLTHPNYQRNITLSYSVIDYTGRPELEERTRLKFQSLLKAIDLIHKKLEMPMPVINILVADTLQRHNFPELSEKEFNDALDKKRGQLAKILGISQVVLFRGPGEYRIDEQTYHLNIQTWDSMLTDEIRTFVNGIKAKLDKASQGPDALQNLCNDSYLFNPSHGLLREDIVALKKFISKQSHVADISHKKLALLGPNATLAAMQFLMQKGNLETNFDTRPETLMAQKQDILTNEIFAGKGLSLLIQGIVYVLEETFVLCNNPSVNIYAAGTVAMNANHPFYTLHEMFKAGSLPFGYIASSEFNNLDAAQLEQHKKNYENSLKNPKPPRAKTIASGNNNAGSSSSSSAAVPTPAPTPAITAGDANTAGDTSPKSLSSSYGSNKSGIITPPEVRAVRRGSVGGSGSGHSSDSEHSDSSKKSSSSKVSEVDPFELALKIMEKTTKDCHEKIIESAAKQIQNQRRGSNAATSAVVMFSGSRSRSHSPDEAKPQATNSNAIKEASPTQPQTTHKMGNS